MPSTPSSSTANPAASDWATARGDKWLAQLSGMGAMLAPVDEPLLRALQLDAPLRIAEIGSGGGGTTLEILRRAPAGSVVHGFDISPALVEVARRRIPREQGAITFQTADMATAGPPQICPTTDWPRASASCSSTMRRRRLPTWPAG